MVETKLHKEFCASYSKFLHHSFLKAFMGNDDGTKKKKTETDISKRFEVICLDHEPLRTKSKMVNKQPSNRKRVLKWAYDINVGEQLAKLRVASNAMTRIQTISCFSVRKPGAALSPLAIHFECVQILVLC